MATKKAVKAKKVAKQGDVPLKVVFVSSDTWEILLAPNIKVDASTKGTIKLKSSANFKLAESHLSQVVGTDSQGNAVDAYFTLFHEVPDGTKVNSPIRPFPKTK